MNTKNRKVDTEALLKRISYRWKFLLLCGVLFGVFWCGYKYMDYRKESAAAAVSKDTETFSNYDAYAKEISRLNDKITSEQKHLEDSILAGIDPYHAPKAVESIVVSADDDSDGLADSLRNYIANGIDWNKAAQAMNISSADSVSELVVTDVDESLYLYDSLDVHSNEITLTVFGKDEDSASRLMDYVNEDISKNFGEYLGVNESAYKISASQAKVSTGSDYYLTKWYDNHLATITNLIDRRTKLQTGQATAGNHSGKSVPTFGVKNAVRYSLTGFVSGLLIGAILAALYLLIKGYVLSDTEMADQFDITLLGKKLTDEDHSKDKFLDHKLASRPYRSKLPEKDRYLLAVNDIKLNLEGNEKNIAVLSDLNDSISDNVINQLSESDPSLSFEKINLSDETPDTQKQLTETDAVVLLACVENSRYQRLNQILYEAFRNRKRIIGVIMY